MSPTAAALDRPLSSRVGFHEIPLNNLIPSPLNPRKRVHGLDELTASVREAGILEPLLVRPSTDPRVVPDTFEVIAGGRRLEAARAAGLVLVPCLVREVSDAQALELAIIENNQRGDIHPLEEAEAFRRLKKLDASYTPETIAAKIGRPLAYVKARLRLLDLVQKAREAFAGDQITLSHAQLLAKLEPRIQDEALEHCVDHEFDYETGKGQRILGPAAVYQLQDWINERVRLDLAAPETQEDFPELATEVAKVTAAGATVLMLADTWGPKGKDGEPLPRNWFTEVKAKTTDAQLGVFVQGRRRGKTVWVTINPPAPTPTRSARVPGTKRTPAEIEADTQARTEALKREQAAKAKEAREALVLTRALATLVDVVQPPDLLQPAALRVIAACLTGVETFGHEHLDTVAKALKVPRLVFTWQGDKERLKLKPIALAKVIAVLAAGEGYASGRTDGLVRDAFEAFGVDLKAIDKAVAKEQAAEAKTTAEKPATKPAKAAKKAAKTR